MSASPIIAHLRDVLTDPSTGVNVVREDVPRPDTMPAPGEIEVLTQLEAAWIARVDLPPGEISTRARLLLRQAGEYEAAFLSEEPTPDTIDIALLAVIRDDRSNEGSLTLEQAIRIARRVIAMAHDSSNPEIVRDGVAFENVGKLTILPPVATSETTLLAGVILSFSVHDLWAMGGA